MVILALLLVAILLVGSMNVAHPFLVANDMHKSNDALEQQITRIHIQNQNDQKAVRALEDPVGIEQAARKYGYIYPNENRLRVP